MIVESYIRNGHKALRTQREFRLVFNVVRPPRRETIKHLYQKFHFTGSVADLPHVGRPKSIRTEENINRVMESVNNDQSTSLRKRGQELCINKDSLRNIMVKDLGLKAYKIQFTHHTKPSDANERLNLANDIDNLIREDENFIDKLIMTDEAHFQLDGYINKQNLRYWGTENPRIVIEKMPHPKRITVFCAITSKRIYGPFYFEDNKGNAATVNKENYIYMLEHSVIPTIGDVDEMWYQQDGAPPHIAHETIAFLRRIFGNKIISKNGNINWPARSPDLSPLDFFLWGYLKGRVYKNKPETIEDLKENIKSEIADIPQSMLKKVMNNFYHRIQQCREREGRFLDDVIFHT